MNAAENKTTSAVRARTVIERLIRVPLFVTAGQCANFLANLVNSLFPGDPIRDVTCEYGKSLAANRPTPAKLQRRTGGKMVASPAPAYLQPFGATQVVFISALVKKDTGKKKTSR